jgi:hypothetical protein
VTEKKTTTALALPKIQILWFIIKAVRMPAVKKVSLFT